MLLTFRFTGNHLFECLDVEGKGTLQVSQVLQTLGLEGNSDFIQDLHFYMRKCKSKRIERKALSELKRNRGLLIINI